MHQARVEKIKADFSEQEKDYNEHSEHHYRQVVRLLQESETSTWRSAISALFSAAGILGSMVALRLSYLALYRPEALEGTSFIRYWYKPTHKDCKGNLMYQKMTKDEGGMRLDAELALKLGTTMPLAAIFASSCVALYSCCCAKTRTQKSLMAKAESVVKVEMQRLQSMWQGTKMAVDAVVETQNDHADLAACRREEHKKRLIKQMLQELWTMSMAVDEMIVWMSMRECFPHNFSVRNMVTPGRYDKIREAFSKAKDAACTQNPALTDFGESLD